MLTDRHGTSLWLGMRVFLDSSQPCRSLRYSAAIMCDCVLTENGATHAFEWYGIASSLRTGQHMHSSGMAPVAQRGTCGIVTEMLNRAAPLTSNCPPLAVEALVRPWLEPSPESGTTDASHVFRTLTKPIMHEVFVCCVFRSWRAVHWC